jgi:hypothetical protein
MGITHAALWRRVVRRTLSVTALPILLMTVSALLVGGWVYLDRTVLMIMGSFPMDLVALLGVSGLGSMIGLGLSAMTRPAVRQV